MTMYEYTQSSSAPPSPSSNNANLATFEFFPRRNLLGKGVPNTNEGRVEKCQESFGNCFYYTLQGFFSGSDATNGKRRLNEHHPTTFSVCDFITSSIHPF